MAAMTDSEISETTVEAPIDNDAAVEISVAEAAEDAAWDAAEEADQEADTATPIREVLERQLLAGQGLTGQLLDTATELGAAFVEVPARVIAEVRDGATLPDALGETGSALQATLYLAGDRVRATVGRYVGGQATLPNAVIVGAAEVAASVVRAQGSVTASAVDAAFAVATVATQGGDIRDAIDREWRELSATVASAREDVSQTVDVAREGVRQAVAVGA
jgi:hypothetical protein